MPTDRSLAIPGFSAPLTDYDRQDEAQHRRELERTFAEIVSYIEELIKDEESVTIHELASNTALGARHTISGAAIGAVLRAGSATTAAFIQLLFSDLGGVATKGQLPAAVAYEDEANVFTEQVSIAELEARMRFTRT